MKTRFLRLLTALVLGCAVVFFTSNLKAAGVNKKAAAKSAAANLLVDAYATLDRADHDYKGHRMAAMKQIEAAAKELGVNVGGDGKGHEKQGVSDEQLRAAEGLLQQAKGELKGKPLHHVNAALKQLQTALKIK